MWAAGALACWILLVELYLVAPAAVIMARGVGLAAADGLPTHGGSKLRRGLGITT
jgi:hypothetical protein